MWRNFNLNKITPAATTTKFVCCIAKVQRIVTTFLLNYSKFGRNVPIKNVKGGEKC